MRKLCPCTGFDRPKSTRGVDAQNNIPPLIFVVAVYVLPRPFSLKRLVCLVYLWALKAQPPLPSPPVIPPPRISAWELPSSVLRVSPRVRIGHHSRNGA